MASTRVQRCLRRGRPAIRQYMPFSQTTITDILICLIWACLTNSSWCQSRFRHTLQSTVFIAGLFCATAFTFAPGLLEILQHASSCRRYFVLPSTGHLYEMASSPAGTLRPGVLSDSPARAPSIHIAPSGYLVKLQIVHPKRLTRV